ncbi:MAG: outer rane immunogenic protein, partial [Verrucomicrobiota bacterium]
MKTILLLSALLISASLAPVVSAQTGASDDNIKTSEPSDKYGPGGTHVTVSDKNYRLIADYYQDKSGKKRESTYHGSRDGKIPPQTTYYDENEKLVVKVFHHKISGDSYVDANGGRLDPTEAKALIAKLEKTRAGSAEKAEEHPKAKPELPSGGTAPSLIPSAQTAPSSINWTGFYMGVQVGYARSSSDYSLKLGGDWDMFPSQADDIQHEASHEFDEDGFGLGGCAGYNYEFQNHLVIGVGIAGRKYWNLDAMHETGDFPSGNSEFDVWSSFNTTGLVTFGPKVGYAVGRFLPYVSGGLAFGELDASQKIFSG